MESGRDELLEATARLVVEDGFDAVSIASIAMSAAVSEDQVLAHFGSLEDLLVAMLDREFRRLWTDLLDDLERDPRGGLLSHIYRYTISGVYESPLVRALYLSDRDGLNTIVRSTHGFAYVPGFGMRADFIERMQEIGMVRPEVDADRLAAVLSAISAGAALTAPDSRLDLVNAGLFDLLSASVDADVDDTAPGKVAFVEYALSLTRPDPTEHPDGTEHDDDDPDDPHFDDPDFDAKLDAENPDLAEDPDADNLDTEDPDTEDPDADNLDTEDPDADNSDAA